MDDYFIGNLSSFFTTSKDLYLSLYQCSGYMSLRYEEINKPHTLLFKFSINLLTLLMFTLKPTL